MATVVAYTLLGLLTFVLLVAMLAKAWAAR